MRPALRSALVIVLLVGLTACRRHDSAAPPSGTSAPRAAAGAFEELRGRADGARDAGHLEEALELYAQALKEKPEWTEGDWTRGLLLFQLKRHAEAQQVFDGLVQRVPDHGRSWAMKGLCEFEQGRYDEALVDLDRGVAKGLAGDPHTEPLAQYHRALLLTRSGAFDAGSRILKGLAPTDPQSVALTWAVGVNLLRLKMLPTELAADQRPLVESAGRAGVFMFTQQRGAARDELAGLVKRAPRAPNVHYAFGTFLLADEPDLALEELQRELKISPEHAAARLQIALEYLKRGAAAKALPFARDAARIDPQNARTRAAYGRALFETGAVAAAIPELEAGIALDAADAPGHLALSKAYEKAGRADDAARERTKVLELTAIDAAS